MSVYRGYTNGGNFYSNLAKPILINCSFIVDAANANGLGIRSLKSNGYVRNVFMHTSSTPGAGDAGFVNPNPALGFALIQMKNNYNKYVGGFTGNVSPTTGSALTTTVAHTAYVISALGTTTLAQWLAVGFPAGFVPAVGSCFIATVSQAIGGTGAVMAPGISGTAAVELIGDPNQMISNASIAVNGGANMIAQFLAPTSSSVTTGLPTNPANNSIVDLSFILDGSSVTIDGL